jgi:outer membrane protein assembly factor BamD (BamD/ComL family)
MRVRSACTLAIMAVVIFSVGCKKGPTEAQLFEQAKKYQEQSNFAAAIDSYHEIVKRFPHSPQAPQCQFMIGYLYANHLKNLDLAKEAYSTFIKDYPEHELVKDAQWELDHLGKDVNEIEELNKVLTNRPDTAKTKADSAH